MAHIYPIKEDLDDLPYSELIVYELLEQLGDAFTVFHSVQWLKKHNKYKSTWKENDFLLLHPQLGGLVIEVKGGDVEFKNGVFRQINRETKEVSILSEEKKNDPLSQAIDGIYHYRKLLDTLTKTKDLSDRFPIEAAVWFSMSDEAKAKISSFPLKYREASGAVLDHKDISVGIKSIYNVFDFYGSHNKVHISEEEYDMIVEAIASDFELVSAPATKKDKLERAFIKLTNEQNSLLDYISEQENATIQGIAGTGKTMIAKEAARRYGAEGRNVLFLCFNKFLFNDLVHRFPYKNVTYFNIHTFIAHYKGGVDLTTSERRSAELLGIDWDMLDFDDVIIDEAQDFLNDEILYFKEFSEYKGGHFMAFFDKNQLLTTEEVPEWIQKSECKLRLTKNCRNTYEIAVTSYNVIDLEMDSTVMSVKGEPTSICFVGNMMKPQLGKLINILTGEKYGYDYSEIVVLSLCSEQTSVLKDTKKISGIQFSTTKEPNSVWITTASKFKGLESKVVIITDIKEDCFTDEYKKRLFYVACSRATQQLFLLIDGDAAQIDRIADSIDKNRRFAAKGQIMMKTHTSPLDLS